MKIGLISDVHGNILALNSILNKFNELNVETILCAGDIIGLGPYPEEAVQTLKNNSKLIAVRGNHEGYLLNGIPKVIHGRPMNEEETMHHKWIHSRLSADSVNFLNSLPLTQSLNVEGKKIYMTHYPISKFGIYKTFIKSPSLEEAQELFKDVDADIFIYGHTHIFCKNQSADKMYLNLESLGCPVKTNFAKAGILKIENGKVEYEDLKVTYDVESIKSEINDLKYPFYESALKIFY